MLFKCSFNLGGIFCWRLQALGSCRVNLRGLVAQVALRGACEPKEERRPKSFVLLCALLFLVPASVSLDFYTNIICMYVCMYVCIDR